jgi:hypothetical protein
MGARLSWIAAMALAFAVAGLLSGCSEPQLHADIKNDVKELDAGSISPVVCTQEFGPGIASLYTYVVAISGSDQSSAVIARLRAMHFGEDPAQSGPGDVNLYTPHRRINVEVRSYSGDQKKVNLGGGECAIPSDGLTEIAFSGADVPTPSG